MIVKADEGQSKNKLTIDRAHVEAMVFLALADIGLKSNCAYKRKITLAKDLTGVGKTKELESFDKSAIPDFDSFDAKMQDAALCAWSIL